MATRSKNFISFVALGRQNPQILNLDFLKANGIIAVDEPPFDDILKQEKPTTKFVSVPGFTNLVLGNIAFIVDEQRFQIRDGAIREWTETKILDIAKKYYEVLQYTPLKLVGMNLNSTISFGTPEEAMNCQELCLPQDSPLARLISRDSISTSSILRYKYNKDGGRINLTIEHPNKESSKRIVNLNYEFDFTDWANFKKELEKISDVAQYCESVLNQIMEVL